MLKKVHKRHGYSLLYDLHSFNYQRDQYDDNKKFPDIIVGTGKIDREKGLPAIKTIIKIMRKFDFMGKRLHVVENSIFPGGNFPYQISNKFPQKCCILSLEFKKFFMNEKTGEPFWEHLYTIKQLLKSTIRPVQQQVRKIVEME
ncbi:MAG: N-formylglutamate amidohydrolase [Candidatus Cloacimonetes bacterium]|nr:N-formylglutamate amidohydrolase [Candidatus Cloacimonadota bacterium]MBS3766735.1 N-formylglutamate amidohydrolase [Candidatus Cloacimonadota bacterium]